MGCKCDNCDSKFEELEIQKSHQNSSQDFNPNKINNIEEIKPKKTQNYNYYKSATLTPDSKSFLLKNEIFGTISDKYETINPNEYSSKKNTIEVVESEGEDSFEENIDKSLPKDDFSKYIFDKINLIRENPSSFIDIIQNSESNIKTDNKKRIIYKSKVKVLLDKGIKAFEEAKLILSNTKPMNKLKYDYNMKLKLPKNILNIKSNHYLKNQIFIKADNGIDIKSFWKEIISDPETCFILMIVDDNGKKKGYKRRNILNPEYKYIGISSKKFDDKNFICYITLR